jgi:hypothetical protein
VERAYLRSINLGGKFIVASIGHSLANARSKFVSSLFRERDRDDLKRREAMLDNVVDKALNEHGRFPSARAGGHGDTALGAHGIQLFRI